MDKEDTLENCPHCGAKLSPWQKVLLKVDRAIVCKNCWYRIILPPTNVESPKKLDSNENEQRGKNGNL